MLIDRQGKYFCANCMYDYTQLNDDRSKLDKVLLENLREGGFSFGFTTALYERVTLVPPREATEYVKKLAENYDIELIPGEGAIFKSFLPLIIFFAVIVIIIIITAVLITIYG